MFSTFEFIYGTQRAAAVTTELTFKRGELDTSRELSQETGGESEWARRVLQRIWGFKGR